MTIGEFLIKHQLGILPWEPLPRTNMRQEILAMSTPEPNTGCWLWLGSVDDEGYGRLPSERAHRASYLVFVGPILFELDHTCRVKCCVNPDHLDDVTKHEHGIREAARKQGIHI